MILCIQDIQNQTNLQKQKTNQLPRAGELGLISNGYEISSWDDENVLTLCDGTLQNFVDILKTTEWYTLQEWFLYVNYSSIKLLLNEEVYEKTEESCVQRLWLGNGVFTLRLRYSSESWRGVAYGPSYRVEGEGKTREELRLDCQRMEGSGRGCCSSHQKDGRGAGRKTVNLDRAGEMRRSNQD